MRNRAGASGKSVYRKENNREFYDKIARDSWSKVPYFYGNTIMSRYWDMREKDIVRRLINVKKGSRVLDVGSGPGRWVIEYSSRGANVVGLDISIEMIKSAKSKLPKEFPKAEFVHGDSEHLPFRDGAFNIINCFDAFPDFPHPLECLSEMKRVLNATGILIVEQTNNLSLIGAFTTISRKFCSIMRRILRKKKSTEHKWYVEWTRYEFPTTVFSWLHELALRYKVIGVNMIPTIPHEAFLKLLCNVEERLENSPIFDIVGYRLVFICKKVARAKSRG